MIENGQQSAKMGILLGGKAEQASPSSRKHWSFPTIGFPIWAFRHRCLCRSAGYEPFIQQKNNHSVRGKKYVEVFYYPSDFPYFSPSLTTFSSTPIILLQRSILSNFQRFIPSYPASPHYDRSKAPENSSWWRRWYLPSSDHSPIYSHTSQLDLNTKPPSQQT
jgi:hypothetical protein